MLGTDAIAAGQVEHMTRRQIVLTLLRTGPLTARGLAAELGRPIAYVRLHLKALRRAGAVAAICAHPARADEVAFSATLDSVPEWAQETLLGEFSFAVCMHVMGHLAQADGLDMPALAEQVGLSQNDAMRYLLFLETLRLVALAPTTFPNANAESARTALQTHSKVVRWKLHFRFPGIDGY